MRPVIAGVGVGLLILGGRLMEMPELVQWSAPAIVVGAVLTLIMIYTGGRD